MRYWSRKMDALVISEGGYGGEALYCLIILWLSIMSWIVFTCVDDDDPEASQGKGGRGHRSRTMFIGAERFCDGTGEGCSGGYGVCGNCVY